jgi:hypothetical protein
MTALLRAAEPSPEGFPAMRKIFFGIMALMLASAPASAQSLTGFFKNANLNALA